MGSASTSQKRKPPKPRVNPPKAKRRCLEKMQDLNESDHAENLVENENEIIPGTQTDPIPSTSTQDETKSPNKPPAGTPIKTKLKRHICKRQLLSDQPHVTCPKCNETFKPSERELKIIRRREFINQIEVSDAKCFLYTGVPTVALLKWLFSWVEPNAKRTKLWDGSGSISSKRGKPRKALSLYEEYLMTLVRIRRGYDTSHLAYLFGVSQGQCSKIFQTWCKLLATILKPVLAFPAKDVVAGNLPESFKDYPKTRVLIDCTEFFVEKPFRPTAQKRTWSTYKHNNTFKLLVGIMPTGTITFLSKLYSGCISDASITEKSG